MADWWSMVVKTVKGRHSTQVALCRRWLFRLNISTIYNVLGIGSICKSWESLHSNVKNLNVRTSVSPCVTASCIPKSGLIVDWIIRMLEVSTWTFALSATSNSGQIDNITHVKFLQDSVYQILLKYFTFDWVVKIYVLDYNTRAYSHQNGASSKSPWQASYLVMFTDIWINPDNLLSGYIRIIN